MVTLTIPPLLLPYPPRWNYRHWYRKGQERGQLDQARFSSDPVDCDRDSLLCPAMHMFWLSVRVAGWSLPCGFLGPHPHVTGHRPLGPKACGPPRCPPNARGEEPPSLLMSSSTRFFVPPCSWCGWRMGIGPNQSPHCTLGGSAYTPMLQWWW